MSSPGRGLSPLESGHGSTAGQREGPGCHAGRLQDCLCNVESNDLPSAGPVINVHKVLQDRGPGKEKEKITWLVPARHSWACPVPWGLSVKVLKVKQEEGERPRLLQLQPRR